MLAIASSRSRTFRIQSYYFVRAKPRTSPFWRDAKTSTRDACATLEQLQPREVLRIDNADRLLVVINHDQIVDAMALEQVENFHG